MLQRFEKFLKNKDKNINRVDIEYNLYNFNFKTIYTGHQFESLVNMSFINFINIKNPEFIYTKYGCIIFYEGIFNIYKLDIIKNYLQELALISYVYSFKTRHEKALETLGRLRR